MLHIVLLILKIIGIVLAAVLGLAVLALSALFFVPLRYRIEAKTEEGLQGIEAKATFSWCLHALSGNAVYKNGKFKWQTKILGKKYDIGKTRETKVTEKSKKKKRKEKGIFKKIKYTFEKICDMIRTYKEKREKLETFLWDKAHHSAWTRIKTEVVRLWKFSRPRKMELNLIFGFDDPSVTGKVLAFLSMLYPFYGENINVTPDFEQEILKGDLFIKGRIHGIRAINILWNLYFDKNVRITYQHIKDF